MSKEIKGYVFKLKPTTKQQNRINQTFGCVRKVKNELLNDIKTGRQRSIPEIKKEYPYTYDNDSQAYTSMWKFVIQGIKDYNKGVKGFPNFSKKYDTIQSYTTNADSKNLSIKNSKIYLRRVGWVKVRFHRELPENSIVKAAAIKRKAGEYFISLRVEYDIEIQNESSDFEWIVGLDYSPGQLYVDQCGNTPQYIDEYKQGIHHSNEKIRELNKILSRKEKGSNNWIKVKHRLQKEYKHLTNKRKDFLHKESRRIVKTYTKVCIEDFDLHSMGEKPEYKPNEIIDYKKASKAKRNRKSMYQTAFRTFTTMLAYKLEDEGKELIKASRWFPSTKECPICKHKQDMPTEIRVYKCKECGHELNRDQNAALNLTIKYLDTEFQKETDMNELKWISV